MHTEYCFGSSPVAAEVLRFRPKSESCMPKYTASESDTEPTVAVSTRKTFRQMYHSAIIVRSPAACEFSGPITRPDVSPLIRFCTIPSWDMSKRPPLEIGHDVRIGANAIILPGVSRIGNGAVIGAGSVVTKDVGPYEIVAGNPARTIRKRFDERQITALENCRWWELDRHELADRIGELDALLQSPENPK